MDDDFGYSNIIQEDEATVETGEGMIYLLYTY
jgi:hypothetical protein